MNRGRIAAVLERALGNLAWSCFVRPWRALCLALAVTAGSVWLASGLSLTADLSELLPHSFKSVQDLEVLKQRFGGIGYVAVIAEGADEPTLKRFADDLAPRLAELDSVSHVDFKRPNRFFEDRAGYYLDSADLVTIHQRIQARVDWEIDQRNPLSLGLEDDEPPPSLDFSDIEQKYSARGDRDWIEAQLDDDYYFDAEHRRIALLAKPKQLSTELGFSKRIVGEVKAITESMDLAAYDPNLRIEFGGNFTKKVDQQEMIQSDLGRSTSIAFLCILLYLVVHFRRFAATALILTPLLLGLAWTHAYIFLLFERLNILTGFIGAILLGLGIDHGIHLLQRFTSEWHSTQNPERSIKVSFASTGRAVSVAALTTLVGFAGLSFSEFRAFREFGAIAAGGIALVVLAYVTCLPALLGVATRSGWEPSASGQQAFRSYARFIRRHSLPLLAAFLVVLVAAGFGARRVDFDYDFRSLTASDLPSFRLDRVIDGLLGHSQTPVVVLADDAAQEQQIATALRQRQAQAGDRSTIHMVATGAEFIPRDQTKKQAILERIGQELNRIDPEDLDADTRRRYERFAQLSRAKPFDAHDLPDAVRNRFLGRDGEGGFVLVYAAVDLSDGINVSRFAKEVRNIPLADGAQAAAAGEPMILADIFNLVASEAPPVLLGTVALVFLAMWLLLGSLRTTALALLPALTTLLVTFGSTHALGLPLNYLNIVMVPVLFGMGVDGGVHLVTRAEARGDVTEAVAETGGAISGALLTTALGFGTLMFADHQGLQSLGQLAVLGLVCNFLSCLLGLPSLLHVLRSRRGHDTKLARGPRRPGAAQAR